MPADVELFRNAVILFWLIPLSWMVFRSLHLKKLKEGPRVWLAAILQEDPGLLFVRDERTRLERSYQKLQYELILLRQSVAIEIAGKSAFQQKIVRLNHEKTQMELRIKTEKNLENGEQRLQAILVELQDVENAFEQHERKAERLRDVLTEEEAKVQEAYTRKTLLLTIDRLKRANAFAQSVVSLTDFTPNFKIIEMAEQVVSRNEAESYGSSLFQDVCVSFPVLARSLEHKNIGSLSLDELKKLLAELECAAEENFTFVQRGVACEKELKSTIVALEIEAKDWDTRSREFGDFKLSDRNARKNAESRLYACVDLIHRLRLLVEGSKVCTAELTKMHATFARKEREVLDHILALERGSVS